MVSGGAGRRIASIAVESGSGSVWSQMEWFGVNCRFERLETA